MPFKLLCITLVFLFSIVGCASQIPVAENFSISTQKKLRSPHHWDVIANDVVLQTKKALNYNNDLKDRPVFIKTPAHTPFSSAFKNFMITNLVNHGVLVTENPDNAVVVSYETQIVHHNAERKFSPLQSMVLVSRNLQEPNRSADYGSTWTYLTDGPTSSELIVTTSIIEADNYRMRKSDVYYVDNEDIRLFLPRAQGLPVRNLKVVAE